MRTWNCCWLRQCFDSESFNFLLGVAVSRTVPAPFAVSPVIALCLSHGQGYKIPAAFYNDYPESGDVPDVDEQVRSLQMNSAFGTAFLGICPRAILGSISSSV